MLSEVDNELFVLCENAVNEIVTAFIDKMRKGGADENTLIEKTVAELTTSERFTISCFIIEMCEDVADLEVNCLPDEGELKEWFRDQWRCALADEAEL